MGRGSKLSVDPRFGEISEDEPAGCRASPSHHEEEAEDGDHTADEEVSASGDEEERILTVKPLTAEALEAFKAAQDRAGVVYISRIPPGMRPTKVRHLMSAYGEVGRVYLQQEDPKRAYLDENIPQPRRHTIRKDGQLEARKDRWRDDVWTMKYLPKFKWNMLTEQIGSLLGYSSWRSLMVVDIAHEAAMHAAQLRVELSQSHREQREYLKNVELARILDKRAERKRKAGEEMSTEDCGRIYLYIQHILDNEVVQAEIKFQREGVDSAHVSILNMSSWSSSAYPPLYSSWTVALSFSLPWSVSPELRILTRHTLKMLTRRLGRYDRDRAWANYERERAAYEYSRRGRSRSPPPADEVHSSWPEAPTFSIAWKGRDMNQDLVMATIMTLILADMAIRAPPDPHTFDYPASLKQYAEWFRYYHPQQAIEEDNADKAAEQEAGDGSKPRNGIESMGKIQKGFFLLNSFNACLIIIGNHLGRSVERQDRQLLLDLEAGKYDPDLNEPVLESAPPVKETLANGDIATNGSAADTSMTAGVEESKPSGDDDMQFNVEAEEEAGDNDASRVDANGKPSGDPRRTNRGEEISVQPEGNQVMIRTIPPDIGRVKLEDACGKIPGFVYLALGDPLQKRNYYRAGWLRFREDADMSTVMAELSDKKIEGFKLHVAHITKPFTSRIRYAPEVASKPDRLSKDLANVKALVAILEEEAATLRKASVNKTLEKTGEASTNGDVEMPPVDVAEAGDDEEDLEPRELGSEAVERRIEKAMADLQEQGLVDVNDEKALEAKKTVISLDLYLAYLRAAFHTCYYCAIVTDHLEELQRKSAEAQKAEKEQKFEEDGDAEQAKDKEKEKDSPAKEKSSESRDWKRNGERAVARMVDSKVALLINRNGVDPRDYGGKSYDEELSRACEQFVKQEDEGKFRCKTCQKLFKATSFVEKHIANKHPELVKHLEEIPYFNNFALDPHRIQPFAHPPPPVGNSQAPPPQAYGLQGPAYPAGADYGRAAHYGTYGAYPPPYPNGGYWEPYAYPYGAYPPPPHHVGTRV
ncbi:Pre-rRNA-processing protein ESF2 [Grifola frondosa]|uniref:Pre-rRNA-processing protein ESF2 n=1 Tax=Grifola frondosa TaxID=5627 RepID=A0A1C7MJC9_GRIFR|nr:Pre-rRNA-processing protein ESF2 [Grifola frondosa]